MFTPTGVQLELRLTRSVLRQLPIRIINADKSRLGQGKGKGGKLTANRRGIYSKL